MTTRRQPSPSPARRSPSLGSGSTLANFTVSVNPTSGLQITVPYTLSNGTATRGRVRCGCRFCQRRRERGHPSRRPVWHHPGAGLLRRLDRGSGDVHRDAGSADECDAGLAVDGDRDDHGIFSGTPLPTLSINNVPSNEGNSGTTPFTFTVTLSAQTAQVVTVQYATANGTATSPSDYAAAGGVLTFAANTTQLTQTVTVQVNGDTTVEADETFVVNLSNPNNATLATAQGTGTIRNDDAASTQPTVSVGNPTVGTGPGGTPQVSFNLQLSPPSSQSVTVTYTITDEPGVLSATESVEEMARLPLGPLSTLAVTPGSATLQPGETSKTVTVTLPNGFVGKVTLTITGATGATIGNASASAIVGAATPPGAGPNPGIVSPTATNPPEDDTDKPRKETEEQRQQRQHTNTGHRGDVSIEGNVVLVERAPGLNSLLVTIAMTRDETQVVQLPCFGDGTCYDIQVGDYLEVDGYQNGVGDPNSYFVASDGVEVTRHGKRVK